MSLFTHFCVYQNLISRYGFDIINEYFQATVIPIESCSSFRSSDTVYARQNGGKYDFVMSGAFSLPTQVQFWDYLFMTGKQWGLLVYEQVCQ